jgi:AcrR family transcriptional regulator
MFGFAEEAGTMHPRRRRYQLTRQSILEAALAIIRHEGPAGLNMRALAERSEHSAAGLYEYFGSKDEIIAEVCREGFAELTREMSLADPCLPAADYLHAIGLAYIRFALANPEHFQLMFSTPPAEPAGELSPETVITKDSSFGILLAAIRRGIEESVFVPRPGFDLLEMAYAAWVTVHGIAMLRLTSLRGFPINFDAADRETLWNFIAGLKSAD